MKLGIAIGGGKAFSISAISIIFVGLIIFIAGYACNSSKKVPGCI